MRVSIRSEQAPQLPTDHVDRPVDEPTNLIFDMLSAPMKYIEDPALRRQNP